MNCSMLSEPLVAPIEMTIRRWLCLMSGSAMLQAVRSATGQRRIRTMGFSVIFSPAASETLMISFALTRVRVLGFRSARLIVLRNRFGTGSLIVALRSAGSRFVTRPSLNRRAA